MTFLTSAGVVRLNSVVAAFLLVAVTMWGSDRAVAQAGPPPVPGAAAEFYLVENGAQTGPFTIEQLRAKAAAGALTPVTLAWKQGMTDWAEAMKVTELTALFGNGPPPAPEAKNAAQFLVGQWISEPVQVPVEGVGTGTLVAGIEFDARGGVKAQFALKGPAQAGITFARMSDMQGTYEASYKNANTILLTSKGTSIIKTISSTGPVAPQTQQVNDSFVITIIDHKTIRDDEGTIFRKVR